MSPRCEPRPRSADASPRDHGTEAEGGGADPSGLNSLDGLVRPAEHPAAPETKQSTALDYALQAGTAAQGTDKSSLTFIHDQKDSKVPAVPPARLGARRLGVVGVPAVSSGRPLDNTPPPSSFCDDMLHVTTHATLIPQQHACLPDGVSSLPCGTSSSLSADDEAAFSESDGASSSSDSQRGTSTDTDGLEPTAWTATNADTPEPPVTSVSAAEPPSSRQVSAGKASLISGPSGEPLATDFADEARVQKLVQKLGRSWTFLPSDVVYTILGLMGAEGHRSIRGVCKSWYTTFGECFTELKPKILVPERLVKGFPNTTHLMLSKSVPGLSPAEVSPGPLDLTPLAQLSMLQYLDLSTAPSLLFFGLGVRVNPEDIRALSSLPNLHSLNLAGQCYGSSWSLDVLSGFTSLTSLSVAGECSLTLSDIRSIACLSNLEHLDLGERRFEAGANLSHLAPLCNLKSLHLSKCYFIDGNLTQVRGLKMLQSLTTLNISCWCSVSEVVMLALAGLTSLVHLDISRTQVTDQALCLLSSMPRLRLLDASYCLEVKGDNLSQISDRCRLTTLHMCDCKKVSDARLRFSLRGTSCTPPPVPYPRELPSSAPEPGEEPTCRDICSVILRGCHKLVRTHLHRLPEHTTLTHLSLPMPLPPGLNRMERAHSLEFLPKLINLQSLHLDGAVDVSALEKDALPCLTALRSLHVHQILPRGACPPLGLLTALKSLTIDSCSDLTAGALLTALSPCSQLDTLHLNMLGKAWAHICTHTLAHLAPVLRRLRELSLGCCTKLDDDAAALLVQTCQSLTCLALYGAPRLTAMAADYIAANPRLQQLDLGSCAGMDDEACLSLAALPSITALDLCGCTGITDAGVHALGRSPALRCLMLRGCLGMSSTSIRALPKWIFVRC